MQVPKSIIDTNNFWKINLQNAYFEFCKNKVIAFSTLFSFSILNPNQVYCYLYILKYIF